MTRRSLLTAVSGVYQLVRFVGLTGVLVAVAYTVEPPGGIGLSLALAASSVLPTLLVLQLAVTGSAALLAPLRVGAFLQAIGAALLLVRMPGTLGIGVDRPAVFVGAAALMALLDGGFLIFVLGYRPEPQPPAPNRTGTDTESVEIETVEDN